jgi:GNAT superfamily N-acetyltransferase
VGRERTEIRRAQLGDAAEMTRLAAQLGYPMSPAEMTRRLTVLFPNERHCIAVAASGELLLGWMHVEHRFSLEGGDRPELMGLVVDSSARRRGVGRELVDVAENWARSRGLPSLTVRSNAARELSHPFYEALGYSRDKTQHVYSKALASRASGRVPCGT